MSTDIERPAGTAGGNCGAQVAVRHNGQAAVATCTDHGSGHYDPALDLSWPAGSGALVRERPAPGPDGVCEDCEHPCGPGGCGCPDECPAQRAEPAPGTAGEACGGTMATCQDDAHLGHRLDGRPYLDEPAPGTSGPAVQRVLLGSPGELRPGDVVVETEWDDATEWQIVVDRTAAAIPQRDHGPGRCVSVDDANRVLAETRGSTEDAVHRVLDLADAVDREIAAQHQAGELTFHGLGAGSVARRIRAAVAGPE